MPVEEKQHIPVIQKQDGWCYVDYPNTAINKGECEFWKRCNIKSVCLLFNEIPKRGEAALHICNKIYSENYVGEA